MKYAALGVVLTLFAVSANAGPFEIPSVLRTEHVVILLLTEPCKDQKVLRYLKSEVHHKYRAGAANNRDLGFRSMCYLEMDEYKTIFIIDEKYDQVDLPKSMFEPTNGKKVNLNDFKKPGTDV